MAALYDAGERVAREAVTLAKAVGDVRLHPAAQLAQGERQ